MAKKGEHEHSLHKSSSHSSHTKNPVYPRETEKLLIENFVSLQKVLVNLSAKFDDLTRQISELLKLFEDSAKIIVKNEMDKKKDDHGERQLLDTMISILDQNKVIAKGLTLIYESMDKSDNSRSSFTQRTIPVGIKKEETVEKRQIVKEDQSYTSSKPENPPEFPPFER